jgi:hypothetical protein
MQRLAVARFTSNGGWDNRFCAPASADRRLARNAYFRAIDPAPESVVPTPLHGARWSHLQKAIGPIFSLSLHLMRRIASLKAEETCLCRRPS